MKTYRTLFSGVAVIALWTGTALAQNDGIKGNGLPQSKLLFNLEVIAYNGNNCPNGDMIGTNTHRIAVKADVTDDPNGKTLGVDYYRQNDILLAPGDFAVLDGNACSDGVARFQLPPNPCSVDLSIPCSTDNPTFQNYLAYARLVGKPGTGVDVRTCASVEGTTDIVCSTENWVSVRGSATDPKPKFQNVSKELLSICLDTNGNGVCDTRYALFAPQFYDYFWNWNTQGKAHAQIFFVAIPD